MVIPCVCYHIEEKDLYEIVDSYHRYMVMKTSLRIYDREKGLLPVVVINKDKCYCNTMGTTTICINPKNDNQYYLDFLKSYFLNVLIINYNLL